LGLNEIFDLFRPGGQHQDPSSAPAPAPAPGPLDESRRAAGGGLLRRKPVREESAVFGRRW
jgi:hypothetical protein